MSISPCVPSTSTSVLSIEPLPFNSKVTLNVFAGSVVSGVHFAYKVIACVTAVSNL